MAKKVFVPTNWLTIGFCFFEGALLSIPVGIFMQKCLRYPGCAFEWGGYIYHILFIISFIALPVWSIACFWKHRSLSITGFLTFIPMLIGVLWPSLNSAS
jgi:hypothetical protein